LYMELNVCCVLSVNNKENLATYEPSSCALQYAAAADKPCSPSAADAVSTKSLAAELARRAGSGATLTDAGNIYTESPPSACLSTSMSSAAAALRRCQSLLDTATTSAALSWQQQPAPVVTSSAQHHSTCKSKQQAL